MWIVTWACTIKRALKEKTLSDKIKDGAKIALFDFGCIINKKKNRYRKAFNWMKWKIIQNGQRWTRIRKFTRKMYMNNNNK